MTIRPAPPRPSIFSTEYRTTSLGIIVLVTLVAFEAMAVEAALPTAARALQGLESFGWAFTGFLVASVVGMVASGQLSDARGPRLPLALGLVGFLGGLLVAGTATTMTQLVAGRVVQGVSGGLLVTAIYVILGETYGEGLRPKIFAAMSSAWVLPSLLGPAVAGTLAERASWRWVFLGLVPFVLVGALLMVPVLSRLAQHAPLPTDPRRLLRALAVAVGVAALSAAGQHPSLISVPLAVAGLAGSAWGLRVLLPPGTLRVAPGVSAPIAMRGLLAGSLFGVESIVPLALSVQHGYRPITAGLPLTLSGLFWAAGSWWQGRDAHGPAGPDRVRLLRSGFALVSVAAAAAALIALPVVPGWLMYAGWSLAGLGAGLAMSSAGILMLNYTTDADRGSDSAALQLADVTTCAVTTGIAGVLVAAAARGAISYTAAFVVVGVLMAALAGVGVAVAGQARPVDR